jgi:hypothetical protein
VELVSLIVRLATVFLKIFDEVIHLIHFHPLHAFPCEVNHEPSDLCGAVLSDELANYELEIKAHFSILDRGYLVASLALFYFPVCLLN